MFNNCSLLLQGVIAKNLKFYTNEVIKYIMCPCHCVVLEGQTLSSDWLLQTANERDKETTRDE